jgi:hypothetical protein
MSIQVSSRVWKNSEARNGGRLVLLALADHADERGFAWPGIDSLAKKTRLSTRHVTRCIHNLTAGGELKVQENRGPRGTNLYQVLCFRPSENITAPPTGSQDDKHSSQMSSEPSEPPETSKHTSPLPPAENEARGWPSEDEVIKHARSYPGNTEIGIPNKAIPEQWAKNYWTWRTLGEERWPRRWREEMFRRFEREYVEGRHAARLSGQKNPAARPDPGNHSDVPPPPGSANVSFEAMRKRNERPF